MDGACSTNGEKRNAYRLFVGKPEGKEDQHVGGRIILRLVLERQDEVWTGLVWLGIGTSGKLL
jgi:hypothetical protein